MFFAGLGNGLGAGLTLGEPDTIWRLTLAGLTYVPAMAVLAGVAAVAVAVRHPWIGWLAVTFVVTSLYLGALLRLPRWLIDLSPVGRTTVPTSVPVTALVVMVAAAIVLTALAGWIYRRRDAL
jgi:ABC-2 type transport system permease protein